MRLRLSVGNGSSPPTIYEHAEQLVRIGRDDGCELTINGDGVSRQHAQVVLSAGGATVADTGSSNGTLLNGALIDRAAPLHVGDQIQLGYTGPTLTVLDLDLTPAPTSTPAGSRQLVLIGSLVGGLVAVAVIVALVLVLHKPSSPEPTPEVVAASQTQTPSPLVPKAQPDTTVPEQKAAQPATPKTEAVAATDPSVEVKPVGSYVSLEHWVSVLLQRQGEGYPWLVLRPESHIVSGCTLVSLPGYRSLITLDSGMQLTLWGDLPEFSAFPPVLESVVLLHAPTAGIDLDFALDRGRVVIANRKSSGGSAQVRVRFLNQTWELELPGAKSEVALELWTPPGGPPAGSTQQALPTYLGVFSKGSVRIRTPSQTVELPEQGRLTWTSLAPDASLKPVPLEKLPAWWTTPPDRNAPRIQKALLSLLDWSAKLGGSNTDRGKTQTPAAAASVVTTIKTQVEEKSDPDDKDLGVSFLAALEEVEPLVDCLNDRQHPNVRGTALFALQSWLGRGGSHAATLAGILERRGFSRDKVERILSLMHVYAPQALDEKQTYVDLVANLDDENLLVRDLAFWQLDRLGVAGRLPPEVKNFPAYDPAGEPDKRRSALAAWKKLLADGKLPYLSGR